MSLKIWRRTTAQQAASCMALYGNTIGRKRDQQLRRGPDLSAVAKCKQFIDILMRNDEWSVNRAATFSKCTAAEVASAPKVNQPVCDKDIMKAWVEQASLSSIRSAQGSECLEAVADTGTDELNHRYQHYYDKWFAPFQFKQGSSSWRSAPGSGAGISSPHMWWLRWEVLRQHRRTETATMVAFSGNTAYNCLNSEDRTFRVRDSRSQ
ncbi:unnamed protein product [Symbiodinium sp. CCMP2456]|nr:unnamed protein product [Symbiodinium sp. CCMP2456]